MDIAKKIMYEQQLNVWIQRKKKSDAMTIDKRNKVANKIKEVEHNVAKLKYFLELDTSPVVVEVIPENEIAEYTAKDNNDLQFYGMDVYKKSKKLLITRGPWIFIPEETVEIPAKGTKWEDIGNEEEGISYNLKKKSC
jgi:hypothetical protein